MNENVNVLIVEDEPMTIKNIKDAFEIFGNSNGNFDFKIKSAKNSDEALIEIDKAIKGTPLDVVFLDINLPPSSDNKILSGEDLGLELRTMFPKIKIIVLTSHRENYLLNNILKSFNPDGFLIKNDIDFKELINSIEVVLLDPPYYSKSILKLLRHQATINFYLNKIDRKLLYLLSKGIMTKDLSDHIPLSKGGIDKRKRYLKDMFGIEGGNDRLLLKLAEEKGFL